MEQISLKHVYLKGIVIFGLFYGLVLGVLFTMVYLVLGYFGQYLPGAGGVSLYQLVDTTTIALTAVYILIGMTLLTFIGTLVTAGMYNLLVKVGGEVQLGLTEEQMSAPGSSPGGYVPQSLSALPFPAPAPGLQSMQTFRPVTSDTTSVASVQQRSFTKEL